MVQAKHFRSSLLAMVMAISTVATPARAQDSADAGFPARPVKLIVSFPPGGFADVAARALSQQLQKLWKQAVIVENRPGGAGIIAAQAAAMASPDGYTLFLATDGPFVINPFIYKTLPYDPLKSFEMVSLVAYTPLVLVVNTNAIASTDVRQFVAYAKSQKLAGKTLDYASSGTGGPHHLSMEEFKSTVGVELQQIPYKGGAQALQDVLGGQVPVMFSALAAVLPQMKAGKIRVLGSGGPKRSLLAPEIPTIAEQGYPNFTAWAWAGVVAPVGTPKAVLTKLRTDTAKVVSEPAYAQLLATNGAEPFPGGPSEFSAFVVREQAKNGPLIKRLDIKLD